MERDQLPTMTPRTAAVRASALEAVRGYFGSRGVLEVETPILSRGACPDRHIELFAAGGLSPASARDRILQSSPELHMKRLLAAGYPDIFQIARVFRHEESGSRHNPEFTMVEWYRRDMSAQELMDEVAGMCTSVIGTRPVVSISYRDAMINHTGIDPLATDHQSVLSWLGQHELPPEGLRTLTDALQYLFCRHVESHFDPRVLTFVHSYPADQAVLATLDSADPRAANRFELYSGGMELANGWEELADPNENARRFAEENRERAAMSRPVVTVQPGFLDALASMPRCSGVAVGFDRLVMIAAGVSCISEVLAFGWDAA